MNGTHIRVSKEFKELIDWIRGAYLMDSKKPPSIEELTKILTKYVNKEKLRENEII